LWDTAGTDEYDQVIFFRFNSKKLRPLSYPDTHIFIIVFSVASAETLQNVENKWVKEIKEHADGIPYILVGNKSDLRNEEKFKSQCVPIEQCEKMRKKIGAEKLMECSAKTQEGLREVFDSCIQVTFEAYVKMAKKGGKNKDCLMM
jgi:small GTP-binding protein